MGCGSSSHASYDLGFLFCRMLLGIFIEKERDEQENDTVKKIQVTAVQHYLFMRFLSCSYCP
jgi:hypothetical protein